MLTCLFINYFSSMNFLVSLQMTTFSKFLRTFITFKFGLTMIQQMPCQCTFITKQFRADIALKSLFIMFNFNMSGEVILLNKCFRCWTQVTHKISWRLDLVTLQLVSIQVEELFIADIAHLLPTVGLEDLVSHAQMLVEVCNLFTTLRTSVQRLLVHLLDVIVVVGFLVCLVLTMNTFVFVGC